MRLVLDTSILIAAIRSDSGASRRLLEAVLSEALRPLLSVSLLFEYEAVMKRSDHLEASGLSPGDIDVLLDAICARGEPVQTAYRWRPVLSDPEDDMVLETAINGHATSIVTFNSRHFEGAERFGVRVVSPQVALLEMRRTR